MIYFISGHRDLSYEDFEKYYIPVINKVVFYDEEAEFVIGDCDGVDKFAMDYVYRKTPCQITIYHMLSKFRNFPEGDPVFDSVLPRVGYIGGFKSDEERDSAMTEVSNFDIAFVKDGRWDSGTAQNIKRRHSI